MWKQPESSLARHLDGLVHGSLIVAFFAGLLTIFLDARLEGERLAQQRVASTARAAAQPDARRPAPMPPRQVATAAVAVVDPR